MAGGQKTKFMCTPSVHVRTVPNVDCSQLSEHDHVTLMKAFTLLAC